MTGSFSMRTLPVRCATPAADCTFLPSAPLHEAAAQRVPLLRARCRNGYERHELLTPGKPETFRIRMAHVGHTFRAGHRLRLEVSSSSFPMIDPNPNTGRPIATETETRPAQQTVFHDADRPSRLVLPVWRPA